MAEIEVIFSPVPDNHYAVAPFSHGLVREGEVVLSKYLDLASLCNVIQDFKNLNLVSTNLNKSNPFRTAAFALLFNYETNLFKVVLIMYM